MSLRFEPKVIDRSSAEFFKLPVCAIEPFERAKHLEPQVIDRSSAVTQSVVHEKARKVTALALLVAELNRSIRVSRV